MQQRADWLRTRPDLIPLLVEQPYVVAREMQDAGLLSPKTMWQDIRFDRLVELLKDDVTALPAKW